MPIFKLTQLRLHFCITSVAVIKSISLQSICAYKDIDNSSLFQENKNWRPPPLQSLAAHVAAIVAENKGIQRLWSPSWRCNVHVGGLEATLIMNHSAHPLVANAGPEGTATFGMD